LSSVNLIYYFLGGNSILLAHLASRWRQKTNQNTKRLSAKSDEPLNLNLNF